MVLLNNDSVECNVTTGIFDHQAVILTLIDANFDRKDTVYIFPNFSCTDDESILDTLDLHYVIFRNFKEFKKTPDVTCGSH